MNWYRLVIASIRKLASVTFTIEGSHKTAQPTYILSLAHELQTFVGRFVPNWQYGLIDMDGLDEGLTGTINVYLTPEFQNMPSKIAICKTVKEWMDQKKRQGFQFAEIDWPHPERSGAFKDRQVWRVSVTKNPTEQLEHIPEINIADMNAAPLLRMLGLIGEGKANEYHTGKVQVSDLKRRLATVTDARLKEWTQDPFKGRAKDWPKDRPLMFPEQEEPSHEIEPWSPEKDEKERRLDQMHDQGGAEEWGDPLADPNDGSVNNGGEGPMIQDFGRSFEQMKKYIEVLSNMVAYCESHGLANGYIVWH